MVPTQMVQKLWSYGKAMPVSLCSAHVNLPVRAATGGMSYGDSPSMVLRTGVEPLVALLNRVFAGEL
jgi:hypothetical protein